MVVTLPLRQINLKEHGYHLFVRLLVNGKAAVFLLDTGASRTVMNLVSASRLLKEADFRSNDFYSAGLGTNKMESKQVLLRSLKIGRITLYDYEMVLMDIDHVNLSYVEAGFKPIDGVLGCDILKRLNAVIDLRNNIIKLRNT